MAQPDKNDAEITRYVSELMANKDLTDQQVKSILINEGFDEATAVELMNRNMDKKYPKTKSPGAVIAFGVILILAGLAVSIGTYESVKDSGGTYFVWWGPVVYGAYLVIKGLINLGKE